MSSNFRMRSFPGGRGTVGQRKTPILGLEVQIVGQASRQLQAVNKITAHHSVLSRAILNSAENSRFLPQRLLSILGSA